MATSVPGQQRFFAVNPERSWSRPQQITAPFRKAKKQPVLCHWETDSVIMFGSRCWIYKH